MTIMRFAVAAALAVGLVGVAPQVDAQPAAKVRRIGYLGSGSVASGFHEGFRQGLRELGWVEGGNLSIEYRFANGRFDRLPELANELVRLKVDVIVAAPTPAAMAARDATKSIPIVMINAGDPVGLGLVASLAQPGGNVTGVAFSVDLEIFGKGLELLKEAIPGIRRVAVLSNPANPAQALALGYVKAGAQSLGLQLVMLEARGPEDFDRAFAKIANERAEALLVVSESVFINYRTQLAELALKYHLPSVHGVRENVEAGAIMSYGPSLSQGSRRAAAYVDKIFRGAKPAELPVELPTRFELVINLKTAKALGLTIPQSVLLRADVVIQ